MPSISYTQTLVGIKLLLYNRSDLQIASKSTPGGPMKSLPVRKAVYVLIGLAGIGQLLVMACNYNQTAGQFDVPTNSFEVTGSSVNLHELSLCVLWMVAVAAVLAAFTKQRLAQAGLIAALLTTPFLLTALVSPEELHWESTMTIVVIVCYIATYVFDLVGFYSKLGLNAQINELAAEPSLVSSGPPPRRS